MGRKKKLYHNTGENKEIPAPDRRGSFSEELLEQTALSFLLEDSDNVVTMYGEAEYLADRKIGAYFKWLPIKLRRPSDCHRYEWQRKI